MDSVDLSVETETQLQELHLEEIKKRVRSMNGPAESMQGGEGGLVRECKFCQKPIPAERLAIIPGAEYCVDCQDLKDLLAPRHRSDGLRASSQWS